MRSKGMSPVRVCYLCENWGSGGIESFLCNVVSRLDGMPLEVDIIAARLGDSIFTDKLKAQDVQFYELSGSMHNVMENHRRFCTILRERSYDVLHLNAFQGLSLAYLHIAKEEGVPVRIAHSHNTDLRKSMTKPLKLAIHRWARGRYTQDATVLWACSKDAAAFLFSAREMDKKGFQFIPNGIDTDRFRFDPDVREAVRRELGLEGKFVIGHVGRLCYQKNQGFLLDVLAETSKERPESVLLLVGEGEDRSELEEKARNLGIANRVLFYGTAEHIERLYWAMDAFVFPSLFEGFGIAAIEARAAGLPIACSEHVPEEAQSVGCTVLPLEAVVWAGWLRTERARTPEAADAVRRAGFDIAQVAGQIGTFYIS